MLTQHYYQERLTGIDYYNGILERERFWIYPYTNIISSDPSSQLLTLLQSRIKILG
jgi:hypothetical protein